jgi:hypothetical protein
MMKGDYYTSEVKILNAPSSLGYHLYKVAIYESLYIVDPQFFALQV